MASDHRPSSDPVIAVGGDAPPGGPPATAGKEAPRADQQRADREAILGRLARTPWAFGFFHTLRRLDCLQSGLPRLGDSARAKDDPVRLGQVSSLIFAPAELAALQPASAQRPARLLVYFLGLLGPNGPLPLHLTEYARDRERHASDPTFARFLDIFHHRILSLFYRGWAQAQPAVSFDRPAEDRFGTYLGALAGGGMPAFARRDAMPDLAKRHYTGHLACPTRHAEGLRAILSDFLGLPVRIDQFIGHWLTLPPDCRLRLGEGRTTGSLGLTTTLGGRVWDHQSHFRVRLGPLGLADYLRLLPGGLTLTRVKAVVRNYVGDPLEWDLNPVLAEPEVPRLRLGAGHRLGWTTWLASGPLGRDGDDLKLNPNLSPGRRRTRTEPSTTLGSAS
jgi:type VI secretion system protein ImpH